MRVALVNLTSGGLSGGYRKYLETLVPLLAGQDDVELEVLSPKGMDPSSDVSERHWSWPAVDEWRGFRALRSHLHERSPDVVFIPTARYVATGIPTVVMVRNMEPLVIPFSGNSLADGVRNVARRYVARAATRKADRVIAVSGYVHDFLCERWGLASEKVVVVPHGIGTPLPAAEHARPPRVQAHLAGRFVFTAGSIRPARGLDDAIGAIALLARQGLDLTLVIAGEVSGRASAYQDRLLARISSLGLAARVIWAGELSSCEMAWCFANCGAFVMTSRVEACPNTALEALAYGAPSVSSTLSPMPEFFGDAAVYYEARDETGLAARLSEVIGYGEDARREMSARARARAALFPWSATAQRTIALLRDASCC